MAADDTSLKRQSEDADELSPYAKKMPRPDRTGNPIRDTANLAAYDAAQHVITAIQRDWEHVLPLLGTIHKRESAKKAAKDALHADLFPHFGSYKRIKDDAFKMRALMQKSDFVEDDLLAMMKKDSDVLDKLLTLITQIGCAQVLPDNLRVKDCCFQMILDRTSHCRNRLDRAKANGCIVEGRFDFKRFGCYILEFDEDKNLVAVTHRATACKVTVDGSWITDKAKFCLNFDDMNAYLEIAPYPKVHVHSFFKSEDGVAKGPFEHTQFYGPTASKKLKTYATSVRAAWEHARQNLAAGSASSSTCQTKLDDMKKDLNQTKMSKARAAAKASAKLKADANIVSLAA